MKMTNFDFDDSYKLLFEATKLWTIYSNIEYFQKDYLPN